MEKRILYLAFALLLSGIVLVLPTTAFMLSSPNGGENWNAGITHTIYWSQDDVLPQTNIQINLYRQQTVHLPNGAYVKFDVLENTIAKSVPATQGSDSWPIPISQTPSSLYRVELKDLSDPTKYDRSDGYFIIAGILVKSPNGNESWQTGTTHSITWTQAGLTGTNVEINLYKQKTGILPNGAHVFMDVFQNTIAASVPAAQGSYSWPIPISQASGGPYRVEVKSRSYPALADKSNGLFTITSAPAATITVTVPNGEESWQRGTPHTVTWDYMGTPGTTVKIVLLKGGVEVGTIVSSAPIGTNGKGSYSWQISSTGTTGSDYKVKVQSISQPTIYDTSNNIFTLTPAGTTTSSITVTSPNGGESWKRGTTQTVKWSFTGNPGSYVKIELLQGGTPVGTATYSTSIGSGGSGSYPWVISSGRAPGTNYRIRVTSVSQPFINDTSNSDFTITA